MANHTGARQQPFQHGLTILTNGFLIMVTCSVLTACGGGSSDNARAVRLPDPASIADDAMVFDSDRTGNYEILTMKSDGTEVQPLTSNTLYDSWWPRLSPDRQQILFYRAPAGVHDQDYSKTSLWLMDADGSNVHLLRAVGTDTWALQGHAEWSPAGNALVMFGGTLDHPQIYATDTDGTHPRRITNGAGYWLDPSWSPDGSRVVFCGCAVTPCTEADFEIYTLAASGSGSLVRVSNDSLRDHDPYYAPDGSSIAWLTQSEYASMTAPFGVWNIRSANTNGSNLFDVTDDRNINSKPDWSAAGDRIYFHRFVYGQPRWQIFSILPDGTDLQPISGSQAGNNEFPDL